MRDSPVTLSPCSMTRDYSGWKVAYNLAYNLLELQAALEIESGRVGSMCHVTLHTDHL